MEELERKMLLAREMHSRFGDKGNSVYARAPGRVDLMGTHTDYNEGFILASAIDRDVMAAARPRRSGVVNLYSMNEDREVRVHVDRLRRDEAHGWANYAKGVVRELVDLKVPITGLDLVVHGEVPAGANLSSSAALEAAVCEAALLAFGHKLAKWEKVHLCRRAENDFVGMPCGIMDQFSVFMGEKDKVLLLDCRSLEFESIPLSFDDAALVVIDSDLGRELVNSKYPDRVKECQAAAKVLKAFYPEVRSLRDASVEMIEKARQDLGDLLYRRVRHVLSENRRCRDAADAAKKGDSKRLGELLNQGMASSSKDYENSTPQIDELASMVMETKGALGTRLLGAGWGGCLIALIEKEKADGFGGPLLERYLERTGRRGRTWLVRTADGAGPCA